MKLMKLQYDQVKIGLQYNTSLINVIFGFYFQDSEETIHSAEINDTSYESQADFHWENQGNIILKIDSFLLIQ